MLRQQPHSLRLPTNRELLHSWIQARLSVIIQRTTDNSRLARYPGTLNREIYNAGGMPVFTVLEKPNGHLYALRKSPASVPYPGQIAAKPGSV
jgi:hypothetical protein